MTANSTYGIMQAQIADEIGDRQDLLAPLPDSTLTLSPIQNAIQDAIGTWERVPFYFNRLYDNNGWSTSAGQEFYGASTAPVAYALIGTIAQLDYGHFLVTGNRYPITWRTPQYMDRISVNPSVFGQPFDGCYDAKQIRFYPIPDAAYPITLAGTQRQSALAVGSDANAWTQDAEALIRAQAKMILARDTLRNDDLYEKSKLAIYGDPTNAEIRGFLYDLRAEGMRRRGRGRIIPTHF